MFYLCADSGSNSSNHSCKSFVTNEKVNLHIEEMVNGKTGRFAHFHSHKVAKTTYESKLTCIYTKIVQK